MFKKLIMGTLLAGLIGILVIGAINRTMDKTVQAAEARGQGAGESNGRGGDGQGAGESNGRGSNGQGGARNGTQERQYPNYQQVVPEGWITYEGTVVQMPEDGEELVIATNDGEELTVGTGPSYMATQGFALHAGGKVQIQGYWEDNEFKAAQVTRMADGQTIALRDMYGRPAWAGGGRNAQGGQGQESAPGDQTGAGQAEVDEWLQVQGAVISVDADTLIVETADGKQILVENRPWWFAQEQGFWAQVGDQVTLTGFYEGGDFEVGRIDDATNGQTVSIRDESGRPLWAGRGRQGA